MLTVRKGIKNIYVEGEFAWLKSKKNYRIIVGNSTQSNGKLARSFTTDKVVYTM